LVKPAAMKASLCGGQGNSDSYSQVGFALLKAASAYPADYLF
jgi:hypothetical protein